jgi:hypothetical protein
MGVFDWIGLGASLFGSEKFAKHFKGSWGVTIGTAISGNYGSTMESYYGPYITHVVDTPIFNLAFLAGRYFNPLDPFSGTVLGGMGGCVTWVYGPNTAVTYGGPYSEVTRAKIFSKTAYTAETPEVPKAGIPLGLWGPGTDLIPAPKGNPPKGLEAFEIATADKKTLLVVNLLSVLLNVTVATLELAAKFKYSSFNPDDKNKLEQPDPTEDDYPLGGINFILSFLPTRIMGLIYTLELAGSLEAWGKAWVKAAKDFFNDVKDKVTYLPKLLVALLEKAGMTTADAIATLVFAVWLLGIVIGIAVMAAVAGS